jgi:hypothetical protein
MSVDCSGRAASMEGVKIGVNVLFLNLFENKNHLGAPYR